MYLIYFMQVMKSRARKSRKKSGKKFVNDEKSKPEESIDSRKDVGILDYGWEIVSYDDLDNGWEIIDKREYDDDRYVKIDKKLKMKMKKVPVN
jgi:hypothetical protein